MEDYMPICSLEELMATLMLLIIFSILGLISYSVYKKAIEKDE